MRFPGSGPGMIFWLFVFCLTLAGFGAPGLCAGTEAATEVLLRSSASWDGTPYAAYPAGKPELTLVRIAIPPKTTLAWHTHPMPNAGYVLSGELTVIKKEDGKSVRLTQGQALPEQVGSVHRGITGETEVVLLVFYAGTQGMPLSQAAE